MFYQITNKLKHIEIPRDYDAFFACTSSEAGSDSAPASDRSQTSTDNPTSAVTLTAVEWEDAKEALGFPSYTGSEHTQANSCRVEAHAKYIFGSLCVPDRREPKKPPLKLIFYINSQFIVFVDDSQTADRVIGRMIPRYEDQEMNPAFFLYGFLQEFLREDMELLEKYEHHLFLLEERALRGNIENLLTNILRARRELTRLRNYYGQMQDLTRGLLANTKHFFPDGELQILTLLSDRASQLEDMTQQSIDYCQTLRDFEQAQSDHKQNKTIRFLTISTSIFFPLTVITGWYGMNFTYMPEINTRFGYFIVIAVSAAVIIVELVILKIKKML